MPTLTVTSPNAPTQQVRLFKQVTSVGRADNNDVRVPDPNVPDTALAIELDNGSYVVTAISGSFVVDGKKRDKHTLREGDVLGLGASKLTFSTAEPAPPSANPREVDRELAALKKLHELSVALLQERDLDRLLRSLMDSVIEVTGADKGFLILTEGAELRVKVARNVDQQEIEDGLAHVSDSIIGQVLKTRKALIVSDALNDPAFRSSESVIRERLSSVMCAPLMEKGEPFGLIYVGNHRITHLFDEVSLELFTIFAAEASVVLKNAMLMGELRAENQELKTELERSRYGEIIGSCDAMKDVYKKIERIAQTDISVLITGETGTGKELIAREIHRRSPRQGGPFISINCGAIPENLLESELFGHVRGAFTGAVATRAGKFQAAHGGTLFLDEVGEMPPALQVKLLRALQEKTVVKVGDTRPESVDIRVLAATNKVLEDEIKAGRFREDLYYRLNVVTLRLPPLRERGEDVQVLAKYFLGRYAREFGSKVKGFAPNAIAAMRRYAWPGNIRQLENRIKKAVVLADKPLITADDLELRPENLDPILPLAVAREEWQKRYINEVLERNNGNRTKTAKDLGVDPRTIFRHLERMEAEKRGERAEPEEDPPEEVPA